MRYIQPFVQQAAIRLLITNELRIKIAICSFLTILSTPIYGTYINPLLQTQFKKRHSSLKKQANSILSKLNIANSPQSTTKFYIINNQCIELQKQQISPRKHALSKGISSKKPLSQQIRPHQKSFHHTNPGKTPHPRQHAK